jgi:hypothetical protein
LDVQTIEALTEALMAACFAAERRALQQRMQQEARAARHPSLALAAAALS